jgi:two-component system, sensor histidine kinase YesM
MIINIADEMKLSEEYLKIQKYTYESDFEYFIDIRDEVKKSLIVKNLLQPLVENAVLHGILGMKSGGVIKLSGKCEDGAIVLEISDNGMGMVPETVRKLLEGEYKGQIGGYGIRNVQKRMSLFYGADSSLQIKSEPKKGTTVIIKVPAMHPDTLPNPA